MKKNNREAARMAGYISEFLHDYAPQFLTSSKHTLKSYRDALTLYIVFLDEKGITHGSLGRSCFERASIEEWIEGCKAVLPGNVQYTAWLPEGISGIRGK